MTIPLDSSPLKALERPFSSRVSLFEGQPENKGKPMGENMHCVPVCECECCI